ncbi:MAG TPA: cupredoxin domain-containing protein [Candidatus Polarisedimenticolia bacterium]|nr:cupredoxin domain-containing protein [Candidatus Polarisedimenticolia bacterium]
MNTNPQSRRARLLAGWGMALALAAGPLVAEQPDEHRAQSAKAAAPAPAAAVSSTGQVRKYQITAAEGGIIPGHIRVKLGDTVRITFVSRDDTYGIRFKEFGIKEKLTPDKPIVLELRPAMAGTFEFKCARTFGFGRLSNNGALVVTE